MNKFESKSYGAMRVGHHTTQLTPNLAVVKFSGSHVNGELEIQIVEGDVPTFFRMLDMLLEEGKRERSLEIQKTLNGGKHVSEHSIKLRDT
jgi:hypothetical protein